MAFYSERTPEIRFAQDSLLVLKSNGRDSLVFLDVGRNTWLSQPLGLNANYMYIGPVIHAVLYQQLIFKSLQLPHFVFVF